MVTHTTYKEHTVQVCESAHACTWEVWEGDARRDHGVATDAESAMLIGKKIVDYLTSDIKPAPRSAAGLLASRSSRTMCA